MLDNPIEFRQLKWTRALTLSEKRSMNHWEVPFGRKKCWQLIYLTATSILSLTSSILTVLWSSFVFFCFFLFAQPKWYQADICFPFYSYQRKKKKNTLSPVFKEISYITLALTKFESFIWQIGTLLILKTFNSQHLNLQNRKTFRAQLSSLKLDQGILAESNGFYQDSHNKTSHFLS